MFKVKNERREDVSLRIASEEEVRLDYTIGSIRVNELVELLEVELGYSCALGWKIFGRSGALHRFDIVAEKGTERIVIDILAARNTLLDSLAAEDELDEEIRIAAVRMRGKTFDCGCHTAAIIRLSSGLPSEGKIPSGLLQEFLNQFNIFLIEAPDIKAAAMKFKSFVMSTEAV